MSVTEIIKKLSSYWVDSGFDYKGALGQFVRPVAQGSQSIIVSTSSYDNVILLELHLGMRHDKIEDMIYGVTKGLVEFKKNSHTVLTSMGRMLGKRYHRYTVSNDHDLNSIKLDIDDFMESQGWHFLDQLTDLNKLDTLFNTFSDYNNQLFYNPYVRAVRGLTVAKISGSLHFQESKVRYRKQLLQMNYPESYISSFNALILVLENYSEN